MATTYREAAALPAGRTRRAHGQPLQRGDHVDHDRAWRPRGTSSSSVAAARPSCRDRPDCPARRRHRAVRRARPAHRRARRTSRRRRRRSTSRRATGDASTTIASTSRSTRPTPTSTTSSSTRRTYRKRAAELIVAASACKLPARLGQRGRSTVRPMRAKNGGAAARRAGGYLIGAIPVAYIAGRLKGIDIRRYGSANVGASNVYQSVARWAVVPVGIAQIALAMAGIGLAKLLDQDLGVQVAAGVAALVGACWSVYLRVRRRTRHRRLHRLHALPHADNARRLRRRLHGGRARAQRAPRRRRWRLPSRRCRRSSSTARGR